MTESLATVGKAAQAVAGEAVKASLSWGDVSITISSNNAQVVGQVVRDVCVTAVTLGALYAGYKLLARKIDSAVSRGLGGERDDQEIRDIKPGSLHVLLHCFTGDRLVQVLQDYECGRMKKRLQEEFSQIGIEVEGIRVEIENIEELRKVKEGFDQRSVMSGVFSTTDEQKRWVVVGICLTKVLTPALRNVLGTEVPKWHQVLCQPPTEINKQVFGPHKKQLTPSTLDLNYKNINNNDVHKKPHAYDYKVKDPLSLAKLFVQPFLSKFTGFDETMDLSAVLSVICEAAPFTGAVVHAKTVRSDVRNEWAHCNFVSWTEAKFLSSIQSMETLLKNVNLSSREEQKLCDELNCWKEEGLQMCFGLPVTSKLLTLLKAKVDKLSEAVETWVLEKKQMTTLLSGIISIQANLNKDLLMRITRCEEQGISNSKEIDLLDKKFTSELSRYVIKESEKIPYVFSAPPRNRYFAGRKEEIKMLKRILKVEERINKKSVRVSAICGLGGVGKTSLVCEYAHQMKDFYKGGVYWFSAEDDTFLEKTVNDIAVKIGVLLGSFDLSLSNILRKMSNANDPSLIVLDCLDQQILSPNMMKFLSFPSQENIFGHFVILTRRNPTLLVNEISNFEEDSCLQLKCFLSPEAKQFLFSRTAVTCDKAVESVAECLCVELGRLPLALEQAGACIKILGCSLSSYLEQYKGERLKLLSQQKARPVSPGNESPERLAVHTTWRINMEYMKKSPNGLAAVTFMNACSFFNANEIEEELINVGMPEVENLAFRKCVSSPLGCRQVLKLLTDFSLFTFVEANSVSTHRLVQELVRGNLNQEWKGKTFIDAVRMLSYAFSKCPSPSRLEEPSRSNSDVTKSHSQFYMWSKLCLHGHYLCRIMENLLETLDSACLEPAWCLAAVKIIYECAVHLSANHKQEEAKRLLNFAYRVLDWLPVPEYEMIKTKISSNSLFPLDIPLPLLFQFEVIQCCMRPFASLQPLTQKRSHETGDFDLEKKIEELRLNGNTNFKEGLYKEALHAYSSAINLAKDCSNAFNPLLLTNRAMVHIKLKQYEDALEDANDYIMRRPDCWRGYARKALALDGLKERVSAEIAASVAFYHRRGIFSDFQPFKDLFLDLQERIFICDSVYELREALLSSFLEIFSAFKILVLGSQDYILISDIVAIRTVVISNCILVGTRRNRSVALKFEDELGIHLVNKCMLTNLSFYCKESQVYCSPGSFVKIFNCYFTNTDGTCAAVATEGELNAEQCEFTNSKSGGLMCRGPGNTVVVVDCSFSNNGEAGLQVHEGGTLKVKNSHIFMNAQQGIRVGPDAAKCVLINCDIHHNAREGIGVWNSKDVTIIHNNVFGNYMSGIGMLNSKADIRENNFFDNGDWGIWSQSNSWCNISMNRVFGNKVGGVRIGYRAAGKKFSPSVLERNKIYDNVGPGFVENVNQFEVGKSLNANEDLRMTYNTSKSSLQPAKCKDNEVDNNKENENVGTPNLSVPFCSNCRVKCEQKKCRRCFTAAYCNKTCQKDHWSKHKKLCKVLLEKSSFVISSMDKVPYEDRTERVEGKKKIGKMFSPPPQDGRRFVVKVHDALEKADKPMYTLILYDRSLELYGKFASKYIHRLVKEFGVICEEKYLEKKLFFRCCFEKNGLPRLFTNEFAEFQDW